jgi:hypothetical protein
MIGFLFFCRNSANKENEKVVKAIAIQKAATTNTGDVSSDQQQQQQQQQQVVVETGRGSKIKSSLLEQSPETNSIISIVDLNPTEHEPEDPAPSLKIYKPFVKKKVTSF